MFSLKYVWFSRAFADLSGDFWWLFRVVWIVGPGVRRLLSGVGSLRQIQAIACFFCGFLCFFFVFFFFWFFVFFFLWFLKSSMVEVFASS